MGSFKYLSEFERGKIELMWKQGHKQAKIAHELNCSRSTNSRVTAYVTLQRFSCPE
ncbi:helix-turn-helix domain-containing protein [Enterococcus faecalis]|nr:helix-turn-helix domain-containing protein [Enterococcus faecalis]